MRRPLTRTTTATPAARARRTRSAAGLAALLLAAAGGAGTAPAHASGSTDVVFEIVDGVLALSAATADATESTTVQRTDERDVVLSRLGTVTVTDDRTASVGWSYSASVPGDIEPVKSRQDRSPRAGVPKPSKSGTQFRVSQAPTTTGSASFTWKGAWTTVNASGVAADLVQRSALGTARSTTFGLEMQVLLPTDTEPGAYKTAITHSVS